jgi:protein-tyrosine phosphatase
MYDFHIHLLPNLVGDDGAKTIEISRHMLDQLVKTGFTAAISVCHLIPGEAYESKESLLKKAAAISTDTFRIYAAHECYLTPVLPEILKGGWAATISGKYVVIELPMTEWIPEINILMQEILNLGLIPVICHPERNSCISVDPNRALELLHLGVLFQLNLSSLRDLSSASGRTSQWLLKHKGYHVAGTDAHSDQWRSPRMTKELKTLKALVDETYFNLLMLENTERILSGFLAKDYFDGIWRADDFEYGQRGSKIIHNLKKFFGKC